MAMMVVSMMQMVSYAAEVWQRTHINTTVASEAQMVLDAVEREMGQATEVSEPHDLTATSTLEYKRPVYDYSKTNSTTGDFRVDLKNSENRIYLKFLDGTLVDGSWTEIDDPPAVPLVKQLVRSRYNYDLSRHVDTLHP